MKTLDIERIMATSIPDIPMEQTGESSRQSCVAT